MSASIVNPQESGNDQCAICLDSLNREQVYEIPECGHKFHTNCIFHWIRSGQKKCPYCGNMGAGNSSDFEDENGFKYPHYGGDSFTLLRQFARRKNSPLKLKKQFQKLKSLEDKQREINKNHKNIDNLNGNFREIKRIYNKSNINRYNIRSRIRSLKSDICSSNNIIPLILLKKKLI